MINNLIEHKIQTELRGNPHFIRYGAIANASGVVNIDFHTKFIHKPFFMCQEVEIPEDNTEAPICFLSEWLKDGDYYTGAKVISDGKGGGIMWMAIGVGVITSNSGGR